MDESIIFAEFFEGSNNVVYTKRSWQYNRGVKLYINGIALPERYQVHFSNSETGGVSVALWVTGNIVDIPDAFFESGEYIHAWVCFAETDGTSSVTNYHIIIPIEKRPSVLRMGANSGELVVNAELDEDNHTLIFG